MQAIAVSTLSVGETVSADLYDSEGELFLRAGQVVRAIDLSINRARIESGLFINSSATSFAPSSQASDTGTDAPLDGDKVAPNQNQTLTVSNLRVGEALNGDIFDGKGLLLLSGGSVITERFIERLKARGIHEVTERAADEASSEPEQEHETDTVRAEQHRLPETVAAKPTSLDARKVDRHSIRNQITGIKGGVAPLDELTGYIKGGKHVFENAVSDVKLIVNELVTGQLESSDGLENVVYSLANAISADAGLAMLLMQYKTEAPDYLYEHCVQTAMVAMRVAAQLDHTAQEVMDIGMAAILQDIGMLRVPSDIRFANRKLNSDERMLVEQHPDHGSTMLSDITGLSATVPTIVFQAHERADGSGYPRRRSGMFIHPLARILGAIDTFVALTQDRPHRPAKHPHHAMMHVLGQAKQGRFDKEVIRGMLESISLFPVGSYVRLSTEKNARVIRSNPHQFARPVVAMVNQDGSLATKELDLIKRPRTEILAPVPAPVQA